ncbi:MAG: DUF4118 domain-containing protein [Rhodospirillaceae bacterium]|nr:DUF4118 domain-containing protein [Rhodospirillaceae bacterium]
MRLTSTTPIPPEAEQSSQAAPARRAGEGRLVAVFGPHADLADRVREAAWAARERRAQLVLLARPARGWIDALQGAADDAVLEQLAIRHRAACTAFDRAERLGDALKAVLADGPATVLCGPVRSAPWGAGLSRAEAETVASAAAAQGAPLIKTERADPQRHTKWTAPEWRLDQSRPWYHDYVLSAFAVSLAAILVQWLDRFVPPDNLAMIFLTAVIYSASVYGFAGALFASVFSLLLYDYFFLPPRFSFEFGSPQKVLMLIIFLVVSVITSNLAGGLRAQARRAEKQATEARALFELTRDIAVARDRADIFEAIVERVQDIFEARCALLAPDKSASPGPDGSRARSASLQVEYPRDAALTTEEIEAARTAFGSGKPAGVGTDFHAEVRSYMQPLVTSEEAVGVLVLTGVSAETVRAAEFKGLIESICRIAGIAVERTLRAREIENARVLAQTEGLRSALLSAISHDFGTPLASVIGSASSLLSYGTTYTPEVTRELLQTILEEAERLNRFVKNVLQMNKLESGVLAPRLQWADVGDLISTALDACHRRLQNHEIYVDIADRLPLAHIDFVLMETVLVNLLDNAAKYAPRDTDIQITARQSGSDIVIDVADQGRGIAAEELGAVFDKFYRAKHRDRTVPGTGLGLAICKGIVEAHGGTVEALSEGLGHGTTMRVRLPVRTPDAAAVAEV